MTTSIAKYAPKTKTYGMTIPLTNRVMIAVDTNNLSHEKYWISVYTSMELKIGTEKISFLKSLDLNRTYKGKYQQQKEVKAKRSQSNNYKIKEQKEQKKIKKRYALRCWGCSIDGQVRGIRVML